MALGFWLEMCPSNNQTGPSGRGHEKYTVESKAIILTTITTMIITISYFSASRESLLLYQRGRLFKHTQQTNLETQK